MKLTIFCSLLLLLCVTLNAQTPTSQRSTPLTVGQPQSVGISPTRLERIDQMALKAIANEEIPGLVALVARRGKIFYNKAYGFADIESNVPMRTDHIFRIASQTKAITSVAAMMLWEEGHFELDEPISKYISTFKNPEILDTFDESTGTYTSIPAKKEITIRQLLTHSSGIGYGLIDPNKGIRMIYKQAGIIDAWSTEPDRLSENIKRLSELPLVFEPGEKYRYSLGIDVIGYLIEIVSGMKLDSFMQERLFEPLGMKDTFFYLPKEKAERLVSPYTNKSGEWVKYQGYPGYYDADFPVKGAKTYFSGGAGLSSTALDYATFMQMLLNKGELNGTRFLSRTTVATMSAVQIEMGEGALAHGLAFGVTNEDSVAVGGLGNTGSFSWGGYFNSQYFADPKEEILGIILKQTRQTNKPDSTKAKFRRLVLQSVDD